MPPKKKPQPSKAEQDGFLKWIDGKLLKIDCTAPKDPGRVTLRRLNRAEYNATIRDLCGVTITPADDFPADDVGYGFDNIGDVLSIQPVLLEKYMAAADQVLESALPVLDRHSIAEADVYARSNCWSCRDRRSNGKRIPGMAARSSAS